MIFIDKFFCHVYKQYSKWNNIDPYDHSAFVVGVLIASLLNCINAVLFNLLKKEVFKFNLSTTGIFLLLIVILFIFYFHRRKQDLESCNKKSILTKFERGVINILILMMLASWFITPILYKVGLNNLLN